MYDEIIVDKIEETFYLILREEEIIIRAKKISKGVYEYKGYRISNCGYHHPDHCIWWEAVNINTRCADYHAATKKKLMHLIDGVNRNSN